MAVGVAECCSRVMYLLGIQQSLQDGLVSLKDGAMLVKSRNGNAVTDILESHEILCEVCTEVL